MEGPLQGQGDFSDDAANPFIQRRRRGPEMTMTKPQPASEADLTTAEIAAAAADMERVLEQEPQPGRSAAGLADTSSGLAR
jgi:hypothetical protein